MAHVTQDNVPAIMQRHLFPWNQWFDGRTWVIHKGDDFHMSTTQMRQIIMRNATHYNVKVNLKTEGDVLTISRAK